MVSKYFAGGLLGNRLDHSPNIHSLLSKFGKLILQFSKDRDKFYLLKLGHGAL